MNYPSTRQCDVFDVFGAVRVADPYRWLEDLDSAEVAEWVAPMPGGAGPMTRAMLLTNVVEAAEAALR